MLGRALFDMRDILYQPPLPSALEPKMYSSNLTLLFLALTSSSLADFEVNLAQPRCENSKMQHELISNLTL
jgi:hypothetical protein